MYNSFFLTEKVQQIRGTVSSSMFGGDRGEISSPNFPDRYALNDETFTYIITNLDPYGKIRIIFDDWDLASVSTLQVKTLMNNFFNGCPRNDICVADIAIYVDEDCMQWSLFRCRQERHQSEPTPSSCSADFS